MFWHIATTTTFTFTTQNGIDAFLKFSEFEFNMSVLIDDYNAIWKIKLTETYNINCVRKDTMNLFYSHLFNRSLKSSIMFIHIFTTLLCK